MYVYKFLFSSQFPLKYHQNPVTFQTGNCTRAYCCIYIWSSIDSRMSWKRERGQKATGLRL